MFVLIIFALLFVICIGSCTSRLIRKWVLSWVNDVLIMPPAVYKYIKCFLTFKYILINTVIVFSIINKWSTLNLFTIDRIRSQRCVASDSVHLSNILIIFSRLECKKVISSFLSF